MRDVEAISLAERELGEVHGLLPGCVEGGLAFLLESLEGGGGLFGGALDAVGIKGDALEAECTVERIRHSPHEESIYRRLTDGNVRWALRRWRTRLFNRPW